MKYLAAIRKKQGLTQTDLAEMIGVGMNSIARYERGEVQPSVEVAVTIAKALHVDLLELLEGPKSDKIKITLSYDWGKYEEGGIDMTGNEFDVFLGKGGEIGLKGSGLLTSREAIEEFLANVRLQVESAFEAQVKRGAIQPSVQGA
ncbi:MAG: helix-turn-helix transcriptional regulator [Synergistaceae bacterium]|nr:helix-turn-helix transcriptional regulator [Synergistaceae bacterium]